MSYGISTNKAAILASQNDVLSIIANLKYSLERVEQGKVKQLAPYLVKAIEQAYVAPASPSERQEKLKAEWQRYREAQAKENFHSLSKSSQKALRQQFVNQITKGKASTLIKTRYQNYGGFDDSVVKHEFYSVFLERLLTNPWETNFSVFSDWWTHQEVERMTIYA